MIKVTHAQLSNQTLQMTMQKLTHTPMNSKTAYRIKKFSDEIEKSLKTMYASFKSDIGKEYGELDEKGNLKPDQNNYGFKMKEGCDEKKLEEAVHKFNEISVTIDRWKLNLSDLAEVKMSASELSAIDPFIEEKTEEELVKDQLSQMRVAR